jgi:hypothetical protein
MTAFAVTTPHELTDPKTALLDLVRKSLACSNSGLTNSLTPK